MSDVHGDHNNAEKELQLCLDDVVDGAGLPFAPGVREQIADSARKKFQANTKKWPAHAEQVRRSARFVGRFAGLFAQFDQVTALRLDDVVKGIDIVRPICPALADATGNRTFIWCPDGTKAK